MSFKLRQHLLEGALQATGILSAAQRHLAAAARAVRTLGEAGALAIVYFLTAQLGLFLLAQPSDVAVFWPASGVAAGFLILSGRRAYTALVIGVVIGTTAANLLGERSLITAILKGFCNAGEAILVAWLLDRWFGPTFGFGDLRRVSGFFAAAGLAAATSAVGGAATMTMFHTTAPFWEVWRTWFLSDGVGIVVVAPFVVALGQLWRESPRSGELIEGGAVLGLLVLTSMYIVSRPTTSWVSFSPGALVLPMLLWLAARCPPTLTIAGAFIVSSAAICATIFGLGRFGDAAMPIVERVKGAQVATMMVTAYTLVLIALFTERRQSEMALKMALDGAKLGPFSANLATGRFECDLRAARMHGHNTPPATIKESRRFVHRDDLTRIDAALAKASGTGGIWNAEYRVMHPPDHPHAGETRWVAVESSVISDSQGIPKRVLGVTRDITHQKQAEQALTDRNRQLELAGKAALVGSFAIDVHAPWEDFASNRMRVSPGFCAIYSLPDETAEVSVGDWRSQVHSDDLPQFLEHRRQVFAQLRGEHHAEFRIVRPCGTIRWIETRSYIEYDQAGHAKRMVGVNIDVTERKRAEEARTILNAELDHRVKNALATVWAVASHTREGSRSVDGFIAALEGRLRSMATTHELLSSRRWQGLPLTELVRRELAPYATRNNTEINGPGILLKPEAGQAVGMVIHELATNAAKYGALSTKEGRVSIRWDRHLNGHPRSHLVLEWQEIGGPPVVAPGASGYGTSTIRDLIPYEFGGTVDLVLAPEGVRCRLELSAEWLSNSTEPVSEADATMPVRARDT
jgi:PAS domain S-box-containing protein